MSKIIYKEADSDAKSSLIIHSDESAELTTSTNDISDSISLELGTVSTTGDDSYKVKESNTISSTT